MKFTALRFPIPILGALAMIIFSSQTALAQDSGLPDGPSKALVVESCTKCHGVEVITAQTRTSEEWANIVSQMVGFGAAIDEHQQAEILTYLKTNLNKAGVATAQMPAAASNKPAQTSR